MNSPAFAMAWQIWTQHRLGLKISAVSLLLMVVVLPPLLRAFDSRAVFVLASIPVVLVAAYLTNSLLFTDEPGNLNSGYPRKLFTLPVSTRTLAFWPMLFAIVAVVGLWLVIAVLIYQRGGYRPPLILPAIAFAVLMAWFQAVSWFAFRSPIVHAYSIIIGLYILIGVPAWLLTDERLSSNAVLLLGLAELALICPLAYFGLVRARRGDHLSLGLQYLSDAFRAALDRLTPQPEYFRSAAEAQLWYEDRCHAWILKGMCYSLLFTVYGLAMTSPSRAGNKFTFLVNLCSLLGTPVFMLNMFGSNLGRMQPAWVKKRNVMTFLATRPILTGDFITAIYRLAARCVLHVLLLSLALTTSWLFLKGYTGDMAWLVRLFFSAYPGWKGGTILVLSIALVPVMSWKLLTDNLVLAVTGRRWIADAAVLGSVTVLMGLLAAALWCGTHLEIIPQIIPPVTWACAVWVIVKLAVAIVAFRLALKRGLLTEQSVVRISLFWVVLAAATMTLLHLALPLNGMPVPRSVCLVSALCILPLGRFALAPLTLDWNRHR